MASQFLFFKGKCKWAHTNKPDKYDKWSVVLYPIPEDLERIKKLKESVPGKTGILNVIGKDEDGEYVKFARPQNKMMRGKVVAFTPPQVLKPDGMPLTESLIGNGSDVTVKIEVYVYNTPTKSKGSACRLETIRVDNLVPFLPQRDFNPDDAAQVRGMEEQPAPLF